MLGLELAVIFVLILVNGLLAMSELAVVSSRPARLRKMVERSVVGSRRALALASDPGRFLSTVQIGITLVGVFSGAFSGATLGLRLGNWLTGVGVPAAVAEATGIGLIVAAITYMSLIVGELVPKQIALRNPEAVAVRVAPAMMFLARFGSPLVWLLSVSGRLVLRILGYGDQRPAKVTEEEIKTLIAEADHAGVLEPGEKEMITAVMRLGDQPVRALMTPRNDVDMISLAQSPEAIRAAISSSPHSRLPVHDGNPDSMLGIIQAKDLLNAFIEGNDPKIEDFVRSAPIVPDSVDARDVVLILQNSPVHIGLVFDEYGHFAGIVTTTDILEAIVGAFQTEEGPAEPAVVRRADGSLLVAGWMPADEFGDLTGIPIPEDRPYDTVAGFILESFGGLPALGDAFNTHGWHFEVVDLDGRRIDKVLMKETSAPRRAVA